MFELSGLFELFEPVKAISPATQLEKHVPKLTVLVNTEAVSIILWNPDRSRIKYDYARMVGKHLVDFLVRVSVKKS